MKVLIVSDIHGSVYHVNKLEEIYKKETPDILIILGDLYYSGSRNMIIEEYNPMKVAEILNKFKHNMYVVKGNCDSEIDEKLADFIFYDNLILDINDKTVFFTHGHKYNVNSLPLENFDIMAYGHLHTGFIKEKDGLLFINPGSISFPRNGSKNSYIIIDKEDILLKSIDGDIIERRKLDE